MDIHGTVTRIVSANNFFVMPSDPGSLRSVDLEGHRLGSGEISCELTAGAAATGLAPKIAPWDDDLPDVGEEVVLETVGMVPAPLRRQRRPPPSSPPPQQQSAPSSSPQQQSAPSSPPPQQQSAPSSSPQQQSAPSSPPPPSDPPMG